MRDANGQTAVFGILAIASLFFASMTVVVAIALLLMWPVQMPAAPAVISRAVIIAAAATATIASVPVVTPVPASVPTVAAVVPVELTATPVETHEVHLPLVAVAATTAPLVPTAIAPDVVDPTATLFPTPLPTVEPPTSTATPTSLPTATSTLESPTATAAVVTAIPTVIIPNTGVGNENAFTCIGGCAVAPDPSCAIKGNVNSSKEKIYHVPGGQYYDRTDIKPEEGDAWFCTSAEAVAAGFRASER